MIHLGCLRYDVVPSGLEPLELGARIVLHVCSCRYLVIELGLALTRETALWFSNVMIPLRTEGRPCRSLREPLLPRRTAKMPGHVRTLAAGMLKTWIRVSKSSATIRLAGGIELGADNAGSFLSTIAA